MKTIKAVAAQVLLLIGAGIVALAVVVAILWVQAHPEDFRWLFPAK